MSRSVDHMVLSGDSTDHLQNSSVPIWSRGPKSEDALHATRRSVPHSGAENNFYASYPLICVDHASEVRRRRRLIVERIIQPWETKHVRVSEQNVQRYGTDRG